MQLQTMAQMLCCLPSGEGDMAYDQIQILPMSSSMKIRSYVLRIRMLSEMLTFSSKTVSSYLNKSSSH